MNVAHQSMPFFSSFFVESVECEQEGLVVFDMVGDGRVVKFVPLGMA